MCTQKTHESSCRLLLHHVDTNPGIKMASHRGEIYNGKEASGASFCPPLLETPKKPQENPSLRQFKMVFTTQKFLNLQDWEVWAPSPPTAAETWWGAWVLLLHSFHRSQTSGFLWWVTESQKLWKSSWMSNFLMMCLLITANTPREFEQIFGTDAELQAFWGHKNSQDPAFKNHPALSKPGYKRKCVPLQIHSDAVTLSKHESLACHILELIFWTRAGSWRCRVLYAAIVKSACTQDQWRQETPIKEMYRCLRWSLAACFSGCSSCNQLGWWALAQWDPSVLHLHIQPLHPEGKFMAVFQLLGDLRWVV